MEIYTLHKPLPMIASNLKSISINQTNAERLDLYHKIQLEQLKLWKSLLQIWKYTLLQSNESKN